ncbi:hypothetical protein MBM_06601 [Drepanopeziza brunnea f. sp. 'multigermtubi' MB_m1]|uniref:Uncharacterized protein n=1 Tax=Marssonina brunnea f. sp. multigermtubi (strain MB_m1) TaxID=1072389 RepID=K1WDA2_MARBU|nr:uncharacterized protein MBM_06601 [Drepanopeziza brunnea f. sp. 'multigermtubi' MB_m1]EKD15385.1 hypothetical protein MBM_06601 [Drepanopeziza brunnea f. sp. 'multigermtubi' MB_m1]
MSTPALPFPHCWDNVLPKGQTHDGIIHVTEQDFTAQRPSLEQPILQTATFAISQKVMREYAPEEFNTRFISSQVTAEDIKGYTVTSIRLWLRILHNTVTPDLYHIPIEDVWYAIAFGQHFRFPITKLPKWYDKWWKATFPNPNTLRSEQLRQLIYPSYEVGGGGKLEFVTKRLWDLAGHLRETNPTQYPELFVPPIAIAARNKGQSYSLFSSAV